MKNLFFILIVIFSFFSCENKPVGRFVVLEKTFLGLNKHPKLKLMSLGGDTLNVVLERNNERKFFPIKTGDTILLAKDPWVGNYELQ